MTSLEIQADTLTMSYLSPSTIPAQACITSSPLELLVFAGFGPILLFDFFISCCYIKKFYDSMNFIFHRSNQLNISPKMTRKGNAKQNFRNGLNCAESVLKAIMDTEVTDFPSEIVAVATGFGGGMGLPKLEQRRQSSGNVRQKDKNIRKNKMYKTASALGICLQAFVRQTAFHLK
jgi:hypothetical protein